jgi:hypothetical protein
MSLSDAFEAALLDHVFENADIANIGDATGLRGSTTAGSLYVALHTADPGDSGSQVTSECTYTGYARKGVARTAGAWDRTGISPTQIANNAAVTFDPCTAGNNTATHFSVGVASAGASMTLWKGTLSASLAISAGITPNFPAGTLISNVD